MPAGGEVVEVQAVGGREFFGTVFAAVYGRRGRRGVRQAVGIVVGELLESVGRGVVDADNVALIVGNVGVEYIVAGRNKAFGQERPLERVGHELELPHIVAPGQQRAGGIIDRFGELRS